jgi:Tol biopolymer transport system component
VTFYSNLRGRYDAWSIRTDGSGRMQLTDIPPGAAFTMFAPDGKRLVSGVLPRSMVIGSAPWPMTTATAKPIQIPVRGGQLVPSYWSRAGRWISGYTLNEAGEAVGFGVIDPATMAARQLNDDSNGYDLAWMPDGRHVVYFTNRSKLVMQDVVTLERRDVMGTLDLPPDLAGGVIASPDGRTLYYAARQTQANIWILRQSLPSGQ